MITDQCGSISATQVKRNSGTALYTPLTSGLYTFEFDNYRNGNQNDLIYNYIDRIILKPQQPTLEASPGEVSTIFGGTSTLTLDAGPAFASKSYMILSSLTGLYPGIKLGGLDVPLVWDAWTGTVLKLALAGNPVVQGFRGTLDAGGQVSGVLTVFGPLPPQAIGLPLYFTAVVHETPTGGPFLIASTPVHVLFIP